MSNRLAAILTLSALCACRVQEPPPPSPAPRITSFTADKQRLSPGEPATLSWEVEGATELTLVDAEGRGVAQTGTLTYGSATVSPQASTVYVLRATGEGGRASAFVQLAVDEPLRDSFLVAVPGTVEAGGTAQLLWQARGASRVTLHSDDGQGQVLHGTTGTVEVSPERSTGYTLYAWAAPGTPPIASVARVEVTPRIVTFTASATQGAQPGQTLTLLWDTEGAERVIITERTFGQLGTVDGEGALRGAFEFVLPATLPGGYPVTDGFSLRFTLSARGGGVTVNRQVTVAVGEGPFIEDVAMPAAVTQGTTFTVRWRTIGADRLEVRAGAETVFETISLSRVAQGEVELPAPATTSNYTVVASSASGLSDTQTRQVRVVAPPVITGYTLPESVAATGISARATWTTENAVRVKLRLKGGAALTDITAPSRVTSGNHNLKPVTTATIVLEALNAAGDAAREEKTVVVEEPAASLAPLVLLRGADAGASWELSAHGVFEVVGLAEPAPVSMPGSSVFDDLTQAPEATKLYFDDVLDGYVRVPLPKGFEWRLNGVRHDELYVSVNGYVSVTQPSPAVTGNVNLTAANAPELIAPLWDSELQLTPLSQVLTAVRARGGTTEAYFAVQWHNLERAGEPGSSYTFQLQLYETGPIVFTWNTMSSPPVHATVGIKAGQVTQQYAFNGSPSPPETYLEVDFFGGSRADGAAVLTPVNSSPVNFYARTALDVMPAVLLPRVYGAGDLAVTEAMPFPALITGSSGQWVEVRNTTVATLPLGGLTLKIGDAGFEIPEGVEVDAGAYLVFGQSRHLLANGNTPVDVEYGPLLELDVPGSASIQLGGTQLGHLQWNTAAFEVSVVPPTYPEGALFASGYQPPACARTLTYGDPVVLGSPGRANESCGIGYSVQSIAGAFVTPPAGSIIPTTGWSNTTVDLGYGALTLPVSFPYWGQLMTGGGISRDGVLRLGGTFNASQTINGTTPSIAQPNGTLAVFWDDLTEAGAGGSLNMWRAADRTIISWTNYTIAGNNGVINAQAHLLDSGVIEFHYGAMSPGTAADRVTGSSATVWLESLDGNIAIPHGINQAGRVAAHSGLRFTPL